MYIITRINKYGNTVALSNKGGYWKFETRAAAENLIKTWELNKQGAKVQFINDREKL